MQLQAGLASTSQHAMPLSLRNPLSAGYPRLPFQLGYSGCKPATNRAWYETSGEDEESHLPLAPLRHH
jgi:hypothetical protein